MEISCGARRSAKYLSLKMSSGLTKVNKGMWMGIKTTPAVQSAISNSYLSCLNKYDWGLSNAMLYVVQQNMLCKMVIIFCMIFSMSETFAWLSRKLKETDVFFAHCVSNSAEKAQVYCKCFFFKDTP